MTVRRTSRRSFLQTTATGGALLGLGDFAFLSSLPSVSAEEAAPRPGVVQFRPEIEPLVRLLEDTPRGRLLEEIAQRVKKGLSYQQVVTALQLAGVQCPTETERRFQIPCCVGRQFGAPGKPCSTGVGSLAADLLGVRLLQEFASSRRARR